MLWCRGKDNIVFNRPSTFFALGTRGSGKSSLLEYIGEGYLERQHKILDLFGSRDGEGLAWCRSPWAEDKKILLIHGDNVDVDSPFDSKTARNLSLSDFKRYDILISSSPLYSSPDNEFLQVNKITNLLYKRLTWKKIMYILVREASNLYYSRLKVTRNQTLAKAEMIYLIREARHMGFAMGLDTLKFTSVDLDVRIVIDYLFFKSQGIMGLPRDLKWMYGYFNPRFVTNMPQDFFLLLTKNSALGLGSFPEVPWHKQERENILKKLGIKLTYGEELKEGEDKGTFKTVSDLEHVHIVSLYVDGLGMGRLGKQIKRSPNTVSNHLHAHDDAVDRSGFCPICKRALGKYVNQKIIREIA